MAQHGVGCWISRIQFFKYFPLSSACSLKMIPEKSVTLLCRSDHLKGNVLLPSYTSPLSPVAPRMLSVSVSVQRQTYQFDFLCMAISWLTYFVPLSLGGLGRLYVQTTDFEIDISFPCLKLHWVGKKISFLFVQSQIRIVILLLQVHK